MSDSRHFSKFSAFCRSLDSLLQLQLTQLHTRGDAMRVFAQLPPFHILQRQWPLVSAVRQPEDVKCVLKALQNVFSL